MNKEELREKIADIVYISRPALSAVLWVGKERKEDALAAVLTSEEYMEIEDKLVSLFEEYLNQNKNEKENK